MLIGTAGTIIPGFVGPARAAENDAGAWTKRSGIDRTYHTATRLGDGRILVAGGCVRFDPSDAAHGLCSKATSSSVLYEPSSGRARATGQMRRERAGASATLLPDGRVLVMGGDLIAGPAGFLDWSFSAEIYDPVTRKWRLAGSAGPLQGQFPESAFGGAFAAQAKEGAMVGLISTPALFGHTATLLPDGPSTRCGKACGKVLLVGRSRADVFDPKSGRWRLLFQEQGIAHRYARTSTILKNGKVLLVGAGLSDGTDVFDPKTATFKQVENLEVPRILHTATLLPGGAVLVAGGFRGGDVAKPTETTEIFNPGGAGTAGADANGKWRPGRNMGAPRFGHTATALRDGKVLVVGGSDKPDGSLVTAELYDPATSKWSPAGAVAARRASPVFGLARTALQPSASGATTFSSTLLEDGRLIVLGGGSKVADVYTPPGYRPLGPRQGQSPVLPLGLGAGTLILFAGLLLLWRRRWRARETAGTQGN